MGELLIREREPMSLDDKRRDKFDQVVHEYIRRHPNETVESVAKKLGCNPSSLWRYRKQTDSFRKAPFDTICKMLIIAKVTKETLNLIIGIK